MTMGLSAEELNAETLYPGDTIEYFSMVRLLSCWLCYWRFPVAATMGASAYNATLPHY